MRTSFLALLAFASVALSAPSGDLVIKETVSVPEGWKRLETASPTHVLSLRLALAQPNMDKLHERLYEVSDPDHELYGRHLSKEEVESLTAPSQEDQFAVRSWLESNGINSANGMLKRSTANGDWIDLHLPVEKAREVFGADFHVYEHSDSGEKVIRTTQYSLPSKIHRSIDTVTGTTYFNHPEAHKVTPNIEWLPEGWVPDQLSGNRVSSDASGAAPASCQTNATTMTCLRELYGTIDYTPTARDDNVVGIGSFLEQHATFTDFEAFLKTERPDAFAANYTFDVELINGGTNDQDGKGGEADLDTQTIAGIGFPIKSTFFSVGGRPPAILPAGTVNDNEPYSEYFSYLLGLDDKDLPSVLSNSYGEAEKTVPEAYARKVCNQIASLTSRGVTIVFSSGDSGVGAGNCTDSKGKKFFEPAFPASCPFVTAVGATENYGPEQAVSTAIGGYFGGGGFSSYWTAPLYQVFATTAYQLKLGKKNFNFYRHTGRGYPDVSAQGSRFLVHTGGRYARIGGTSASAPLFSSIVSQLNDARLKAGKSKLGFLNPLLYKKLGNSKGFTDITIGSNDGCGTDGFPTEKGWDAATGFGTPNFKELMALVA